MARILISGASGGLGQAVTHHFLATGHSVVAVASRAASLAELGDAESLTTVVADLTAAEGAQAMADAAREALGGIDAYVHLLGGFAMGSLLAEDAAETWRRMFRLNTEAAFLCFHAVLPSLIESKGAIVAVSSQAASAPGAKVAAYTASKAALEALVISTDAEFHAQGVRVNAVAPSTIDTPANRAAMGDQHADQWVKPEVLAATLAFLVSSDAADIHGAVVKVG